MSKKVELLRQQLERSEQDKARMQQQLTLTEGKVDDLSENLREFSHVRLELEEQLAAQQMLLQGALKVRGSWFGFASFSSSSSFHFFLSSFKKWKEEEERNLS